MTNYFGPIPPKRKKVRTKEVEKRAFPQHRRFIREHVCAVPTCYHINIECAHVRAGLPEGEQAGVGQKPHDCFTLPLCHDHHAEQHAIGEASFEAKYSIRLLDVALGLSRISPCPAVKAKARRLGT